MTDYLKFTKDGYEIKKLYWVKKNVNTNPFLMAVIYRPKMPDYLWAYGYNPRTGEWVSGHYGYESITEAVKSLKKEYRNAKFVSNPYKLVWLKSNYMKRDGFGWYELDLKNIMGANNRILFRGAYHISKSRGDILQFVVPSNVITFGNLWWDTKHRMCVLFLGESAYQVYADGHLRQVKDGSLGKGRW